MAHVASIMQLILGLANCGHTYGQTLTRLGIINY